MSLNATRLQPSPTAGPLTERGCPGTRYQLVEGSPRPHVRPPSCVWRSWGAQSRPAPSMKAVRASEADSRLIIGSGEGTCVHVDPPSDVRSSLAPPVSQLPPWTRHAWSASSATTSSGPGSGASSTGVVVGLDRADVVGAAPGVPEPPRRGVLLGAARVAVATACGGGAGGSPVPAPACSARATSTRSTTPSATSPTTAPRLVR